MKLLNVALIALIPLVGCGEKMPAPANHDFLTRCTYTFYKSYKEAGPAGVMVDMRQGSLACHLILTAGHVVDQVYRQAMLNNKYDLGFRKDSDINVVRRIEGDVKQLQPFKHPDFPAEDCGLFAMVDVSGITGNSGLLCSINLDRSFGSGVGVIREYGDYALYGIQAGTEVFALCTDLGKRLSNDEYDWSCTTIERTGKIIDLQTWVRTPAPDKKQRVIVVDFAATPGNSGGPVFARGKVDGVEYPILLGVVSGHSTDNKYTYVAPVDSLLRIVREQLNHPARPSVLPKPRPVDKTLTRFAVDKLPCQITLPRTPPVYDIVCETVAYAALPVLTPAVKEIAVEIAADAVMSNALRVAFAADANRNGLMEHEECRVQFGWDAGRWMARDVMWNFDLESPPVSDGRHAMRWVWTLDGNGKTTGFRCEADGEEIFAELKSKLSALAVQPNWNLIQIMRNGVPEPNESVVMTFK